MSFDANIVILIGRLTRDPELSYTKSNTAICKFSIANNRGTANNQDDVNFFNITVWDKVASTCAQYLKKGSQVHITGKLKQDRWKDEAGNNRSKVEVTGSLVQFIGGKRDDSQAPAQEAPAGTPASNNSFETSPEPDTSFNVDEFEDNKPF
jgi:single-strand DNA-binding protein